MLRKQLQTASGTGKMSTMKMVIEFAIIIIIVICPYMDYSQNTHMQKRKLLYWFLIIFVLYTIIALVGFGIVYFVKTATQQKKQTQPTNIQPHKATVMITPPTTWKKYETPKKDFSLSYPEDLSAKETSYGLGISSVTMKSADNTDPNNAPDYQLLTMPKTIAKNLGQDFNNYYAMADNETKTISNPFTKEKTTQQITKIDTRDIKNHRAVDYKSTTASATNDAEAEIGIFIEDGDNIIMISTGESNKAELEQVIGTLTFEDK
jgi:hypothetical protein